MDMNKVYNGSANTSSNSAAQAIMISSLGVEVQVHSNSLLWTVIFLDRKDCQNGSNVVFKRSSTLTVPTAPLTAVLQTSKVTWLNFTNAANAFDQFKQN